MLNLVSKVWQGILVLLIQLAHEKQSWTSILYGRLSLLKDLTNICIFHNNSQRFLLICNHTPLKLFSLIDLIHQYICNTNIYKPLFRSHFRGSSFETHALFQVYKTNNINQCGSLKLLLSDIDFLSFIVICFVTFLLSF